MLESENQACVFRNHRLGLSKQQYVYTIDIESITMILYLFDSIFTSDQVFFSYVIVHVTICLEFTLLYQCEKQG